MDGAVGGGGDADVKRAFDKLSAASDDAKAFSSDDAETVEEDLAPAAPEPEAAEEAEAGNDDAIQSIAEDAKATKAEADNKPHPEKPDSRDDPDVGEPGADEVEGITPVPPGVMGRALESFHSQRSLQFEPS